MSPALKNPLAAAAALGAILLAGSALAAPATTAHHHHHAVTYAQIKAGTIDERIATLHRELMITPDEEAAGPPSPTPCAPTRQPCRN
jgi:hypothetical protein